MARISPRKGEKEKGTKGVKKSLRKKSINTITVGNDFNIRTEQTPCRYKDRGCPYVDTSLKTTRQA